MKQNVIVFFVVFESFILVYGFNIRHEMEIIDRKSPDRPMEHMLGLSRLGVFKPSINSEQNVVQEHSSTVHTITKRAFRKRFRRRPPAIAFQAVLKKKSMELQTNEPIKFDRVFTNEGEGYDEKTGIFTAPVGGLYVFSATILAGNGYYTEGTIVAKDETIVTAVSDRRTLKETEIDTVDQSTVTCTLAIKKGDTVKFLIKWPMGQHEIIGHGKTSFGGYLFRAYRV
ncbi:EMIL1-like protein [Mya arenaria]|uniref:EMIL1-like protein n=1 Tax=Mya arenaria TaxID=6604 RepID=A0ABY7EWI3_MYAAR|nr:EMILIN-1-like [Mya arenaria]WAR13592.1 EMIL1-like protein [Mya arenaria]